MLLNEAFPKNPAIYKGLKEKFGITTVEEAQALTDKEIIGIRHAGKAFLQKLRAFRVPEHLAHIMVNGKPLPKDKVITILRASSNVDHENDAPAPKPVYPSAKLDKIGKLVHELLLSDLSTEELEHVFNLVLFVRKG